ncbi:Putative structural protein [Gordonia phage GTE6]|uniref:Putative structural protein n=1 Tax=Gordonia phage GTE6 TaxID=1647474 RepID=A0A0K0MWP8_9CAUD|nr:major head protein [Gordonia phage GTE6]AKI28662.1 Putative structural protein [Gordonia phage GTE6]
MGNVSLEKIIEAAQTAGANGAPLSQDERRTKIKELLGESDRSEVDALLNEAIEKFQDLNAAEPTTDAELFGLELLVDAMETTREVQNDLDAADQAKAQARADLAARAAKITGEGEPAGEEGGDGGEGANATDTGDPAKVEGESTEAGEGGAGAAAENTEGGEGAEAGAENAGAELVTAAARPHFSVGSVAKRTKPVRTEQTEQTAGGLKIITAAGVRGREAGDELGGIKDLAAAASARIKGLPTKGVRATTKADIASLQIQFPEDLVASGASDDGQVLRRAVDESRLEGGELTAAGWCAPSDVLYDIPGSLTDANAGLLDLPEVQMTRGGLRFRRQVDFGAIYAGGMAGRVMTEAQADSEDPEDYTKQFYRVDCPDFDEVRADAVYTGATAGILQNHAYPEEVEAQISELIAAHAHRVNAISLARVETLFAAQNAVNFTGTFGPSISGASLNAIEWLITNERYRYRASESMRFKVVLPIWYKPTFRADYALRTGVDNALAVTDAQIEGWFSDRGASVDWVYDWQDALVGGGTGVGQAATLTAYPTSVKALVYPEGTIVRGRGDIINLEAVYDSVGLTTNDFLRLFMEESLAIAWRAYRGSVATLPIDVNGATGAARDLDHNGKIVVVTP